MQVKCMRAYVRGSLHEASVHFGTATAASAGAASMTVGYYPGGAAAAAASDAGVGTGMLGC